MQNQWTREMRMGLTPLFVVCVCFGSAARAEHDEQWRPIPGSAFGDGSAMKKGINGGYVSVNPVTGEAFVNIQERGFWRSTDGGKTFVRLTEMEKVCAARCLPGPIDIGPDGKKIAVYNWAHGGHDVKGEADRADHSICAYSLDSGQTWTPFGGPCGVGAGHQAGHGGGAMEPGAGTTMLISFESSPTLQLSTDLGKTWASLDEKREGVFCLGVFSPSEFILVRWNGIWRTGDAGKTWTQASQIGFCGTRMIHGKDAAYLASPKGLVASKDKGKTWDIQGVPPPSPVLGEFPFCRGADEGNFVVATRKGLAETKDGGKSWTMVTPPLPQTDKDRSSGSIAFDPAHNVYYFSACDHTGHCPMTFTPARN
ncbi:MAG: hypothetical protein NTW87_07215 [Planctomycetota bacterium]|nr:hypothetical protein [Planctomycetota bacterium]